MDFPRIAKTWSAFTPKITLDYRPVPGTMVYATWSQGYQPGIFNASDLAEPGPVNPEKLNSFEIGSKSTLLDGRAQLDLAGFLYDFRDLQVEASPNANTPLAIIENAASARYEGIEGNFDVTRRGDSLEHPTN